MTTNFDRQLKILKNEFEQAKSDKVRLETRKEEASKRRKEAAKKIKDMGYDPKDLATVIAEKEKNLTEVMEDARQYLPGEEAADDDDDMEFEE